MALTMNFSERQAAVDQLAERGDRRARRERHQEQEAERGHKTETRRPRPHQPR